MRVSTLCRQDAAVGTQTIGVMSVESLSARLELIYKPRDPNCSGYHVALGNVVKAQILDQSVAT